MQESGCPDIEGRKQDSAGGCLKALETEGITTREQRGIHILWRLAQEGLICFGPRQGSRYTFVLLEEWAPAKGKPLSREMALREMALRFINSHGPATRQDFTWWSGLTSKEAAAGLEAAEPLLGRSEFNGQNYWYPPDDKDADPGQDRVHFLPAFDEYLMGYKDRSHVLAPQYARRLNDGGGIIKPAILVDGTIRGTWKKKVRKGTALIVPEWFDEVVGSIEKDLEIAARRFGEFLGLPVIIEGDIPGSHKIEVKESGNI